MQILNNSLVVWLILINQLLTQENFKVNQLKLMIINEFSFKN